MNDHQLNFRTLYLDGRNHLRVLQDGPALRIRQPHVSDRLFPLRLLVQVIVNGPVEWSTNALLACAEASVPVVFLRRDGSVRGRVVGTLDTDPLLELNMAVESLLMQPEGQTRYHVWFSARSQHARLELLHTTAWRMLSPDLKILRKYIEQRARLYARADDIRRFDRHLYSLLLATTDKFLRQTRLDPDHTTLHVKQINITRDFTNILIWSVQKEKLRYLKQLRKLALRNDGPLARLDWARAVQFVERNRKDILRLLEEKLMQFHIFLLESIRYHGNQ